MNKPQAGSIKIKAKRLSIRRTRSPNRMGSEAIRQEAFDQDRESSLPPNLRSRLWALFAQIEREFECVHAENLACKYTKILYLVCISSFDKIIDLCPATPPVSKLFQTRNSFYSPSICSSLYFESWIHFMYCSYN